MRIVKVTLSDGQQNEYTDNDLLQHIPFQSESELLIDVIKLIKGLYGVTDIVGVEIIAI